MGLTRTALTVSLSHELQLGNLRIFLFFFNQTNHCASFDSICSNCRRRTFHCLRKWSCSNKLQVEQAETNLYDDIFFSTQKKQKKKVDQSFFYGLITMIDGPHPHLTAYHIHDLAFVTSHHMLGSHDPCLMCGGLPLPQAT